MDSGFQQRERKEDKEERKTICIPTDGAKQKADGCWMMVEERRRIESGGRYLKGTGRAFQELTMTFVYCREIWTAVARWRVPIVEGTLPFQAGAAFTPTGSTRAQPMQLPSEMIRLPTTLGVYRFKLRLLVTTSNFTVSPWRWKCMANGQSQ